VGNAHQIVDQPGQPPREPPAAPVTAKSSTAPPPPPPPAPSSSPIDPMAEDELILHDY